MWLEDGNLDTGKELSINALLSWQTKTPRTINSTIIDRYLGLLPIQSIRFSSPKLGYWALCYCHSRGWYAEVPAPERASCHPITRIVADCKYRKAKKWWAAYYPEQKRVTVVIKVANICTKWLTISSCSTLSRPTTSLAVKGKRTKLSMVSFYIIRWGQRIARTVTRG